MLERLYIFDHPAFIFFYLPKNNLWKLYNTLKINKIQPWTLINSLLQSGWIQSSVNATLKKKKKNSLFLIRKERMGSGKVRRENITPIWLIPVMFPWNDASGAVLKMFDSCCKAAVSQTQQDLLLLSPHSWFSGPTELKQNNNKHITFYRLFPIYNFKKNVQLCSLVELQSILYM